MRRNKDPWSHQASAEPLPQRPYPPCHSIYENEWHPMARRFWDVYSTCRQARLFIETDWFELEQCMNLVHEMYVTGKSKVMLAAEIRQRVAKWGSTVDDRARLRMTFDDLNSSAQGEATDSKVLRMERFKRLGGV
ncbi:hypothetical protein [Streptomyces sp. CBMA123]|uniref:phage terminase small subunit n=1 Tax=Streptomyces sp. CBMA123 TaxID=1896313 RepID=UPI0016618D14|nr:hypothetical protein [Streptomyces sp. CBMA123]